MAGAAWQRRCGRRLTKRAAQGHHSAMMRASSLAVHPSRAGPARRPTVPVPPQVTYAPTTLPARERVQGQRRRDAVDDVADQIVRRVRVRHHRVDHRPHPEAHDQPHDQPVAEPHRRFAARGTARLRNPRRDGAKDQAPHHARHHVQKQSDDRRAREGSARRTERIEGRRNHVDRHPEASAHRGHLVDAHEHGAQKAGKRRPGVAVAVADVGG